VLEAVQQRVFDVLRKWVSSHFSDFQNRELFEEMIVFCDGVLMKAKENANHRRNAILLKIDIDRMISLSYQHEVERKPTSLSSGGTEASSRQAPAPANPTAPPPRIPANLFSSTLTLMDIDPIEIANQLTLMTFSHYAKIQTFELLDTAWTKPKLRHRSPNVIAMIRIFDHISTWVIDNILSAQTIKLRKEVVHYFIVIADMLHQLHNYDALHAVLSGFVFMPVQRLKYTWDEISKRDKEALEALKRVMHMQGGYKNYKTLFKAGIQPPAIPRMGIHFQDLMYVDADDSNPTIMQGMVNFGKMKVIFHIIKDILQFQQFPYNLVRVPELQTFIMKGFRTLSEVEFVQMSERIEPKTATRAEIK